ncbi:MAG: type I 3-dehydroquinate dehydratase [Persephonella sp.]|nr:type I 3-dehydroquinate dehydratase [Persephonella sp.]
MIFSKEYVVQKAKTVKDYNLGIIATVRSEEEGGTFIPDEDRLKIFEAVAGIADIIDIELTSEKNKQKSYRNSKR